MKAGDHRDYFAEIKGIWAPISGNNRIIPFCTPTISDPKTVVIGTNHSDFAIGGGLDAERIAEDYEKGTSTENTYIAHNHAFSKGIRAVCDRADVEIGMDWLGTNRCAIQSGPEGIEGLSIRPGFADCQRNMDKVLKYMVMDMAPENVILVGMYAAQLFFPHAKSFVKLTPKLIKLAGSDSPVKIIPIKHVSRATFWESAALVLREYYRR